MKLPDVNVLVHAVDTKHPNHAVARFWLQDALVETGGVGFAWVVLVGFVRVSTRAGILTQPLSVADALSVMDDWLGHAGAKLIHPGERHAGVFGALLLAAGGGGNLTNDAHLGALAIENDAKVGTFDKDFKRFPGVKIDLLKTKIAN
jgi:uncharacterized protein